MVGDELDHHTPSVARLHDPALRVREVALRLSVRLAIRPLVGLPALRVPVFTAITFSDDIAVQLGRPLDLHASGVWRADGSVAVTRTKGRFTSPDLDGKPVTTRFHSIEVVRKQPDGTWRFVIDDPTGEGLEPLR